MQALHHFARRCRWPSPMEILDVAGQGETSGADKATELVNKAIQGIRLYGKNALKAKENLPVYAWTAVQEWGGWTAWSDLDDQRLDRARGAVRLIIERYLKTAQTATQLIENDSQAMMTRTDEEKRTEALKRDETHNDPQKRQEIANLASELAKKHGWG